MKILQANNSHYYIFLQIGKKIFYFYLVLSFSLKCMAQQQIKLGILTVRDQNDAFFSSVVDFTRSACKNLNMDLIAVYGNNNIDYLQHNFNTLVKEKKIDAFLILNYKDQLRTLISRLEENKIPFFIYNAGFSSENNKKILHKYKYFLGEMLPADEQAGYQLAKELVAASQPNKLGEYHILALGGEFTDQASVKRISGLKRYIRESKKKIVLSDILYANWSKDAAASAVDYFETKYAKVSIIWAASDNMALGAYESLKKQSKRIAIGGIDWSLEGVKAVHEKKLTVSIGGHFMEGAWIAILLYDYFHGVNIFQENINSLVSWMSIINKDNSSKYYNFLSNKNRWEKIDFKKLSKSYNSKLKSYDFSEKNVLPLFFAD